MDHGDVAASWAIALIALVTLGTRLAGPALVRLVRVTPATERFLDATAIAVIAAILASEVMDAGMRGAAAAAIAALVMLASNQAAIAMMGAMAFAGAWSRFVGA